MTSSHLHGFHGCYQGAVFVQLSKLLSKLFKGFADKGHSTQGNLTTLCDFQVELGPLLFIGFQSQNLLWQLSVYCMESTQMCYAKHIPNTDEAEMQKKEQKVIIQLVFKYYTMLTVENMNKSIFCLLNEY